MRNKCVYFVYLVVFGMALGLCASAVGGQGNPTFVKQGGRTITVLPTGADDTANLQCAFDNAVALGPGVTVRLVAGTYHTRQIVVNNFKGAFVGAGADKSVLTNLPGLVVTHPNAAFYDAPPTPSNGTNTWPTLVAFVNGDFLVSDMQISITGRTPFPAGYKVFNFLPTLTQMFQGFAIVGTTAKAIFLRVDVKGEKTSTTWNMNTTSLMASPSKERAQGR